jgi:hypothetical protein
MGDAGMGSPYVVGVEYVVAWNDGVYRIQISLGLEARRGAGVGCESQ